MRIALNLTRIQVRFPAISRMRLQMVLIRIHWILLYQVIIFSTVWTKRIKVKSRKDAVDYLTNFGYLKLEKEVSQSAFGTRFEKRPSVDNEKLSTGLKEFQSFFGLPITGQLDNATLNLMSRPRCGNLEALDIQVAGARRRRRYAHSKFAWTKQNLTYRVSRLPTNGNGNNKSPTHLKQTQLRDLIEAELAHAFSLWADVVELNFFKAETETDHADIDIKFVAGAHGDDYDFDGVGLMIAHAFHPNPANKFAGDIHFDDEETWIIGKSPKYEQEIFNFRWGAIHEIGHSLGLEHSNVEEAYMYPIYPSEPYSPSTPLHADDVFGIEAVYKDVFSPTAMISQQPTQQSTSHSKNKVNKETVTDEPEVKRPKIREHRYSAKKLQKFTEGLVDILFAFNPTSTTTGEALLACKLRKNSNRKEHLCVPDTYLL